MKSYRKDPKYIECKTKRVQILIQPSIYESAKKHAEEMDISLNEYIGRVLRIASSSKPLIGVGEWKYMILSVFEALEDLVDKKDGNINQEELDAFGSAIHETTKMLRDDWRRFLK